MVELFIEFQHIVEVRLPNDRWNSTGIACKVIAVDRSTLNFSYVSQAAGFSEDLKHLEICGKFD